MESTSPCLVHRYETNYITVEFMGMIEKHITVEFMGMIEKHICILGLFVIITFLSHGS